MINITITKNIIFAFFFNESVCLYMGNHYQQKDMQLEHVLLGMYKISTSQLQSELNLRYSI